MLIRPMTQADIPSVVSIAVDAFTGDELFQYTYPNHKTLPSSYSRQKLIRFKQRLITPNTYCFVAKLPKEGRSVERGEVVGYACWENCGLNGEGEDLRGSGAVDRLERVLLAVEMWYEKLTDRACNYKRMREYAQITSFEFYSSVKEYWNLSSIAVMKRHQRGGVGRELMEWGMRIAGEKGVPVLLQASRAGRRLYEGLGFRVVEVKRLEEVGLEGVLMAWEKGV